MKYINELRENENIREVYLCKQFQELKTKAGKDYYSVILQDKTGTLDGKIWDFGSGIEDFAAMDYVYVEGLVTKFQGNFQLNIKRARRVSEGEYNPADFMPVSARDVEEMYSELVSFLNSVKNEYLKKLLMSFFSEDKEFIERFKGASAAKSVHHAFVGGLLEHTLGVVSMCNAQSKLYKLLNRDLLITAAALHDIGKMNEISAFPENDYTGAGNLLGHIYMGAELVGERIKGINGFPKGLEMELKHCILAHHGELEYGSPKKPALAEAIALYFADNFDAKMETMKEVLSGADPMAEWVGYQKLFESNIKRTTEE